MTLIKQLPKLPKLPESPKLENQVLPRICAVRAFYSACRSVLSVLISGEILLFRSPDHPITCDHPIFFPPLLPPFLRVSKVFALQSRRFLAILALLAISLIRVHQRLGFAFRSPDHPITRDHPIFLISVISVHQR